MDVRLKPFDFSQALARTGALTDGQARRMPPAAPQAANAARTSQTCSAMR